MPLQRSTGLAASAALGLALTVPGAFGTAAAQDASPPWYVGLTGEAVFLEDSGQTDYETGYGIGGIFGYEFGNGVRAEGELGYRDNDFDGPDGDTTALYGMASGYYDFDLDLPVTPYVGAGLGYADVTMDGTLPGGFGAIDDSDGVLAYQLAAGVTYDMSEQISLFAGYRWLATEDAELTTAAGRTFESEYQSHNFQVGARFRF